MKLIDIPSIQNEILEEIFSAFNNSYFVIEYLTKL